MIDLHDRTALVMGVANEQSIAWGIAQRLAAAGAKLAFTYLPDPHGRAQRRVGKLAETVASQLLLPCDVRRDEDIASVFTELAKSWGKLDCLIHSIAWARADELSGELSATSREGFAAAADISAYSLIATARQAKPLMVGQPGSIVTLTYLGSQRAMPGYNVMGVAKAALEAAVRYLAAELGPDGIRVNAVSPGPIETLSASAIDRFPAMLRAAAESSPLRRAVTAREVGDIVAFLCSDLARAITGQVVYADAGYSIIGA